MYYRDISKFRERERERGIGWMDLYKNMNKKDIFFIYMLSMMFGFITLAIFPPLGLLLIVNGMYLICYKCGT